MSREIPLMREFLAQYRHPRVRLFRRQVIDKTVQDVHSGRVHQVKAGIKGQADVYGFIKTFVPVHTTSGVKIAGYTHDPSIAVPFEVEFKAERTRVSAEQERWKEFCAEWGIPHLILRARIGESQEQTLTRWNSELDELVAKY